jgi:uncharacterized membrane protein
MDDVTVARAIHVLAVIHWMGGVGFVTAVVLPAIAAAADPSSRLALFEAIERRFSIQVKVSVPVAGLSGAYMFERLDVWNRFLEPEGWWLAAMAFVWLVFMVILFVIEPFVLRDWFHRRAMADPSGTFLFVQRAHWGLLTAGMATAAAAVLGAHGLLG